MPQGRAGYVVDIQSGLLDTMATRVVIPLLPRQAAPPPAKALNPVLTIGGVEHVLMTQNIATVPLALVERDQIVRAIDALLSGL
jgi:toxin CcdB